MKITVAKDAGYCFGVRDAVNMAYDASEKYGEVFMLGDIVHNENVVKDLESSGAKVVDSLDTILDATCPLVHEIHREVKMLEAEGRKIVIIGDHGHDEVEAIADQVENPVIISSKEEAMKIKRTRKIGVVSQSTQMIENVQEIINTLMTRIVDIRFINTICYPTKRNHEQIKELSKTSDIMIIIGSFTSANSKRLTELSKQRNKNTYQVTCAEDIKESWFENIEKVGISAGASTPDYLIEGVERKIKMIAKERE